MPVPSSFPCLKHISNVSKADRYTAHGKMHFHITMHKAHQKKNSSLPDCTAGFRQRRISSSFAFSSFSIRFSSISAS